MEDNYSAEREDGRCEDKCTLDWVECMDTEDRASICKTRERNCFAECNQS